MLHDAVVSHRLPGRTRIRLSGLKQDPAGLGLVVEALRRCPSVVEVESNTLLGSVLIHHTEEWEAVARWAAGEQLFRLTQAAPVSVHGRLREGVDWFSRGVSTLTGEPVDVREWLTVGLIGLAIQQAIEGNVMVPAVSLLWYAYNAARMAEGPPARGAASAPEGGGCPPTPPGESRRAAPPGSGTAPAAAQDEQAQG